MSLLRPFSLMIIFKIYHALVNIVGGQRLTGYKLHVLMFSPLPLNGYVAGRLQFQVNGKLFQELVFSVL